MCLQFLPVTQCPSHSLIGISNFHFLEKTVILYIFSHKYSRFHGVFLSSMYNLCFDL